LEQNLLVEKLSLQAESFQEGFEALIKCNSLEEIAKNFGHLLRGNFILSSIHILHRLSINAEWKYLGSQKDNEGIDQSLLSHNKQLSIKYFTDKKFSVVVVLPLSDSSYLGIFAGNKLDALIKELQKLKVETIAIIGQVTKSHPGKIFII